MLPSSSSNGSEGLDGGTDRNEEVYLRFCDSKSSCEHALRVLTNYAYKVKLNYKTSALVYSNYLKYTTS